MQEEEITRLREQVEIVKENAGQESAKVEAIIRLETERNVYKEQCERLLERIMNGGAA